MLKLNGAILVGAIVLFSACNGSETKTTTEVTPANTETTTTPVTETPAADVNAVAELTIDGNDQMQFDKKELRVKAGQKVKLTLTHSGKMDKKTMGHNWVLLAQGMTPELYGKAAAKDGDADHISKSESANVIAHTKTIGAGESDTIEFTAPEAGVYDFVCSFPGHWGSMNGKFIVE
ncbi:MAG: azurin [Ferruginibacter sp.]